MVVPYLLGFLGVALGIKLLPRAFKYAIRRFLLGTISEIIAIVIAGLLTEQAVDLLEDEA